MNLFDSIEIEKKKTDIVSVSEYLDGLNSLLKSERAKIVGEVTGVQEYPGRSYLYFSLKDKKDQSTVKCFMWKNDYKISGVTLRDGLEVIVTAYPNVYKPNGGMTMQVESVELVGEGALQIAYEQLKKKLEDEGLLAETRKRAIPTYPTRIGVITSKSGAVINDFLTNIGKFGFQIYFVDSKVEGQDAIKDLLSAVATLKKKDIDVLVMMRGGGSLESFLAFNNEMLVRAVVDFPVPVLTGIGHDKDVSLVALASDKNVSTPTAVANLLNSSWNEALGVVKLSEQKIISEFESRVRGSQFTVSRAEISIEKRFVALFETFRRAEETLVRSVSRIESGIKRISDFLVSESRQLIQGFSTHVKRVEDTLVQSAKSIELSNPERQLKRGYSILKNKGKIVKSVKDTAKGDQIDLVLSDGIIKSQII